MCCCQEKELLAKQRQEELESQEAQEREAKQVQEDGTANESRITAMFYMTNVAMPVHASKIK